MIIGIGTVILFIGSLILGDHKQMMNLYFWSTLILFMLATVPVFTEVGTSAKIAGKTLIDEEKVCSQRKEKQPAFDPGARITYLSGLAGISTFILSFLALSIG